MAKPIIFDILAVDEASRTFTKVGMAAGGMATKVESAGKVASRGFLYAGVAAGALAVHSIKMAGDFDAAIVRLETTAGESKAALGQVSDGLLNMAGKVGYTAQQLAKGMYTVESAGFHGAAGLKVMEAAAKGARVEGADLTATTDAVSSLLVDYHLHASDAARVTNVLTAAVGHGKTTFEQLATALPNVAAAGASAKISMEEVASAIATMTMHGTDAAKAGTYLRQVIGQLEGPSAKASDTMESLGINVNQLGLTLSSGSGHGLADAIKMVDDAIRKHLTPSGLVALDTFTKSKKPLSDYQKVLADLPGDYTTSFGALSKMVGGVKSLQGFLQLGGENLKTYRNNVKAVREQVRAGGNDVEGYAQQQQTLNGKLQDAQGAASAFSVKLGKDLEPAAKAVADALDNHHKAAAEVVVALTAVAAGLGVVKVATATTAAVTAVLGGEETFLALRMTAGAVAAGDMAGAMAGLSLAAGSASVATRALAGAGGLGLLMLSANSTNKTLSTLESAGGGALMGFAVGGPIGAAIGGGAGALLGLARAAGHATNVVGQGVPTMEKYAESFRNATAAITSQTHAIVRNNLQKTTAVEAGKLLGVSETTLVRAIEGHKGAQDKVNEALKVGNYMLAHGTIPHLQNGADAYNALKQAMYGYIAAEGEGHKGAQGLIGDFGAQQTQARAAAAAFLAAKKALDSLPSHKKIQVDADVAAAQASIRNLQNTLDNLSSHKNKHGKGSTPKPKNLPDLLNGPMSNGRVVGPSQGSGRALVNTMSGLVPGITESAHHLSAVFINNLADGISKRRYTVANALDKVKEVLTKETEKLQNLLQARTAIVQGFQGMSSSVFGQDFSTTGGSTVSNLIGYENQQLQQALQVQADVAKLVSEGLSKSLVTQLANSGSAGIANLHALAGGSLADVQNLNALDAQTSAALSAAGMTAGNSIYGSQIQAAQRDQATAQAIVRELTKWRHQEDKNTVIQLAIGAKTVQATLLELKRHNGNKPLGLS